MFIKNLDGFAYELDLEIGDETMMISSGYKIAADKANDSDPSEWIELTEDEMYNLEDEIAESLAEEYRDCMIMAAEAAFEGDR